jgi:TRAP-type C4-dicarboxylate transport system substrate-binding protein
VSAVAVIGGVASAALAAAKRPHADGTINITVGYVTTPTHPYGLTLERFERLVESNSNGRVQMRLIPSYAQANDITLLNDVNNGVIEGGGVSAAVFPTARISAFIPLQLPFLVDNYQLERRVINNSSGIAQRMLRLGTRGTNLVGLSIFEGGMRQLILKKPVNSLADLRGIKLRSVEAIHLADSIRALGMSPTPLPLGEVFSAIRSGTVDGMEANSALVFSQRFDEAGANRINIVNMFPFPAVVVFNRQKFNALPQDIQQLIRNSARDLPAFSISTLDDTALFPGRLCARGVRYHQVPTTGKRAMIRATQRVERKYTTGQYRSLAPIVASIKKQKGAIRGTATDTPPANCLT